MNQPEPQSLSFSVLMSDIEKGIIKIPQFQRDFVWTRDKSAKLIDSILKGFPIGTFILWKTKERLRTVKNIGGAILPDTPDGDFVQHVLDGQQRLTSLFASVRGLKVDRDGHIDDFGDLFIDLIARDDQDIVLIDRAERDPTTIVRIVDLLNADLEFLAAYPRSQHRRLSEYKKRLETYAFSVVLVKEAPIDVATEIFTRINVTGKPLSVFEIMVAKTFDSASGFDLSEKMDEVLDDLKLVNYETIRPETILQAVAVILKKECAKKDILRLDKIDFIGVWDTVISSVYSAVEYFRNYFRIPASRLLPFSPLLVPFSYFFWRHPDKPSGAMEAALQDFFWRASLTGRYSSSLEGRLAQDVKRMDAIVDGVLPEYDAGVDTSGQFIRKHGAFTTSRSYIKAILSLLAYYQPKSFANNSIVRISNDWLKQANSRNYHHFFPRAFLKKEGYDDWEANHVGNITIVDDYLNKRDIGHLPPAEYMARFKRLNPLLAETMRTHLIDVDSSAIWENDYERFLQDRCEAISKELRKRIVPRAVDGAGQALTDDTADEEQF